MACPAPLGKYEKWTDTAVSRWHTSAVRYGQYCPVAKAAEVLGERWTMLIVRDLMMGAHRFNDLYDGLAGISRTLLSGRLRQLESEGLIERRSVNGHSEYWLTSLGEDLQPAVMALGEWAVRHYGRDPERDELDPEILMLWIERRVVRDALPPGRFVVRFEFEGDRRHARAWLVCQDGVPRACHDDPRFDVDLVVTSDVRTLHRVFAGRHALSAALREGSIALEGTMQARRAFTRWFGYSPFANATREALAG
jgi:DNA-binding HxlR family transcriptional regulator